MTDGAWRGRRPHLADASNWGTVTLRIAIHAIQPIMMGTANGGSSERPGPGAVGRPRRDGASTAGGAHRVLTAEQTQYTVATLDAALWLSPPFQSAPPPPGLPALAND